MQIYRTIYIFIGVIGFLTLIMVISKSNLQDSKIPVKRLSSGNRVRIIKEVARGFDDIHCTIVATMGSVCRVLSVEEYRENYKKWRYFGDNSFWIENPDPVLVEEWAALGIRYPLIFELVVPPDASDFFDTNACIVGNVVVLDMRFIELLKQPV